MSDTALIHSGSGDNIAGSKIYNIETYKEIINATTPESLKKPVNVILDEINNRNFDGAREKIKLIESMGGLESEVTELLAILKIKCEYTSDSKFEIDLKEITTALRTSENAMIKDLALSLILSVEVETKGLDKAKERFEQNRNVGPYSKAIALNIFSNKEELLYLLHNEIHNISEHEINGVIGGLIRLECFEEAQRAAEYLKNDFDNYNSKFIDVYTKALLLNESIKNRDYWILTQSEKEKVDELVNESIMVYKESDCNDFRLFNIFFPALSFIKLSNEELLDICKLNIDKVNSFSEDYADELRILCKVGTPSENHPTKILEKINNDKKLTEEKVVSILKNNEVDFPTFWIAQQIIPKDKLIAWIDNGVSIIGNFSDFENKLNKLSIALLSENESEIKKCVSAILSSPKNEHEVIKSEYLMKLSDTLYYRGCEKEACDLLLYFINNRQDIWCSPLVENALYRLHSIARHKDVISLSNKVNDKEKPIAIYNVIIWTHLYHGSAQDALAEAKKYNDNNNIENILLKLSALYKLGKYEDIDTTVSKLDISLLAKPERATLGIIDILIKTKHLKLVESIIIDWFINSLEENYLYISQACLQIITSEHTQEFQPSYNIKGLEHAVQYSDGDRSIVKILASDDKISNRHILTPNSILAKAFKDKEIGDEIVSGVKTLKLEKIFPPFIAIKDISSNIRDESNDGSDAFQILRLSEDPDIMMEQFRKSLPQNKINDSLFTSDNVPLAIRMHLINKSDPIKPAMMLLTNPLAKFKGLVNEGRIIESDACTDIITILYLCLTSTSAYFVKKGVKLHLIQDDIDAITQWVTSIENDKFVTVSKDDNGRLHYLTSEHVKLWHGDLIENLNGILPLLNPLTIIPDNYEKQFTDNIDIYGHRFVQSMYAIKNSNIPLFSIDTQSCWLMKHQFNINTINPYKLINDAVSQLSKSERYHAVVLHALSGIPFPIHIADFISLAGSRDDLQGHALYKLLGKYVGLYNENLVIEQFLPEVFSQYFYKVCTAYVTPKKFKNMSLIYAANPYGPKIDRIFNLCCNSVLNHKSALSNICAEEKLAEFYVRLGMIYFTKTKTLNFLNVLFLQYIQGNFLSFEKIGKRVDNILISL